LDLRNPNALHYEESASETLKESKSEKIATFPPILGIRVPV
jgi:hypothetical protein